MTVLLKQCNILEAVYSACRDLTTKKFVVLEVIDASQRLCEVDKQLGLRGKQSFKYCIEVSGGLDLFEELQFSQNAEIYSAAQTLLQTHFEVQSEVQQVVIKS